MRDIFTYNRSAWNRQVAKGNPWTIPVSPQVIADARRGNWSVLLTPQKRVPREWFGSLQGAKILALAAGGGQQGPVLSAAGASVVVLDASSAQLNRDQEVAAREGLDLAAVEGDMRDLSQFPDGTFDLIFHPVSNCFIPDPRPVWREAVRVLKPGGALLAGFCLPHLWLVDANKDERGEIDIRFRIPYADVEQLSAEELAALEAKDEPFTFGHRLDAQISGQLEAGLVIVGFYEDSWPPGRSALGDRIACFAATRAIKGEAMTGLIK